MFSKQLLVFLKNIFVDLSEVRLVYYQDFMNWHRNYSFIVQVTVDNKMKQKKKS